MTYALITLTLSILMVGAWLKLTPSRVRNFYEEHSYMVRTMYSKAKTEFILTDDINQAVKVADELHSDFKSKYPGNRFIDETKPEEIVKCLIQR